MPFAKTWSPRSVGRDVTAGIVVFLVALPLCLGVALASNAPLFSGLLAGIIGGIVVGVLSRSHTSVSGPAAGLTAIVAAQISSLGSFNAFLLALTLAGAIQVVMGIARGGFIAAYVPSSVINGLLAAIGVILILKQIPHLFGHDSDPEGEMSFHQPDHETTFSELREMLTDIHPGATVIGLASMALLYLWDHTRWLKKSVVPAPLVVVLLGVGASFALRTLGGSWVIDGKHLVQVPIAESVTGMLAFFQAPDFSQWLNPAIYTAAVTIALVASLETLLNLEAVDKLDPRRRNSPPSRELIAQGVGNMTAGLVGAIPVTSVIVRSSVNIHAGAESKLSTIVHGTLLLTSVVLLPAWLNQIPLSCLAAILLMTGIKLASPKLVKKMWSEGRYQFIPFIVTVVAIVLTDLLIGIVIGLLVSISFILNSNFRLPIRRFREKHLTDDVLHLVLQDQVSFLKRASLSKILDDVPAGGHVLIDARNTDYIDPDVLSLIRDYQESIGPARNVQVSLLGFREKYQLDDCIQFVDYSTRELQSRITPEQVLEILKDGHERFRRGRRLHRDLARQDGKTAAAQHPLGVVLSCIDSRVPAESIFDLGVGDIFSVRIAGNITSRKILGSLEYACAVAGAKLIVVMGHTRCGAVTAAVDLARTKECPAQATGCQHAEHLMQEIQKSLEPDAFRTLMSRMSEEEKIAFIDTVARDNVIRTVCQIPQQSKTLAELARQGKILVVGAMYDVISGDLEFLDENGNCVRGRSREDLREATIAV